LAHKFIQSSVTQPCIVWFCYRK